MMTVKIYPLTKSNDGLSAGTRSRHHHHWWSPSTFYIKHEKIENYEQFTTGQETSDYIFIQSIKLELDKNVVNRRCYRSNHNHRGLGLIFKTFMQYWHLEESLH